MKIIYNFLFSIFLLTTTVGQDITATLQGSGSSFGFSVNNSTPTTLFRVRGDGNVGIGTTSPGFKLELNGDIFINDLTNDANLRLYGNGGALWIISSISSVVGPAGILLFEDRTNFKRVMALQNLTGNVGIGTDNPSEKLEVTGGVKLGNTTNTNAGTIRWTGSSFQGYDGSLWNDFATTSGDGDWNISGSDMYSAVSGNVGIGTTSPVEKFVVRDGNLYVQKGFSLMNGVDGGGRVEFVSGYYLNSSHTHCDVVISGAGSGDGTLALEVYYMIGNGSGYGAAVGKQVWAISSEGTGVPTTFTQYDGQYNEATENLISTSASASDILVTISKKYSEDQSVLQIVLYGAFDPALVSFSVTPDN